MSNTYSWSIRHSISVSSNQRTNSASLPSHQSSIAPATLCHPKLHICRSCKKRSTFTRRGISLAYHIHGFSNVTIHPHRSNETERNDLPKRHKYGRCTQTHNARNRLRKQPAQLVYTYMLPHFRVPIVPRHTFQRSTICNALPSSCSATSLAW
jgi:hypothetical protein